MSGLVMRDVMLLALRLDRLVPGLLDGPVPDAALARHVADEPAADPRLLARRARTLVAELPASGLPPRRARYVEAQLRALECRARLVAGDDVGFADEVAATYGVDVRCEDPDRYRAAHRRLAELLPGRGPLASRLSAHREADRIPPDRLADAVEAMAAHLREPVVDRIGLPDGESVTWEVADGRPWTAFTHHLGGGRSRIAVDASAHLRRGQLLPLVAHEAYPGHHTQYCHAAAAGDSLPELRLRLVHSPQGLLAEGAAEAAHHVLPGPGWGSDAEHVLAGIGLPLDGGLAEAVEDALDDLGRVRQDAAVLRYARGAGPDEVLAHLRRWLLIDEARARRMLGFLDHPHWRTYATAYAEGRPLVTEWLRRPGTDPVDGLRRLLDEPITPGDLRDDLARAAG
nr:DUF885 domain-containing protein [Pseudonocardia endophytica]